MAVLGNDDEVLDPHPEPARQVDAGLDGDDFAGGEDVVGALGESRGPSWTSRPTPCPSPWPKCSPWPAASITLRATASTSSPLAPARTASSAASCASSTTA